MVGGAEPAPGTMVGGGARRAQHPAEERGRALREGAAGNETAPLPAEPIAGRCGERASARMRGSSPDPSKRALGPMLGRPRSRAAACKEDRHRCPCDNEQHADSLETFATFVGRHDAPTQRRTNPLRSALALAFARRAITYPSPFAMPNRSRSANRASLSSPSIAR